MAQRLKRLPARQETQVQSLGGEDPLEKEMATHCSILAWRIPRTVHRVAKSRTRLSDFTFFPHPKTASTSVHPGFLFPFCSFCNPVIALVELRCSD